MNLRSTSRLFHAETGVFVPTVTAEQMRELDRIATNETGPTLLQMMENAGRNLASLAMELLASRSAPAKVLVLAGGGGNGGGGICGARHLSNHGLDVSLCVAANRLSDAASLQRKIFRFTAGNEVSLNRVTDSAPDFIIDALIGYGLRQFHSDSISDLIRWGNKRSVPVLSLDVPSGVDASTGVIPDEAIHPTWTLTLALPKSGLSAKNSGELFLADIGIPISAIRRIAPAYQAPYGKNYYVRIEPRNVQEE